MNRNDLTDEHLSESSLSLADDLQGYLGLGMTRIALRLARRLLKQRPLGVPELQAAVEAVSMENLRVGPWKPLVEAAYGSMSRTDKKAARFHMLAFYTNFNEWQSAFQYTCARPDSPAELLLTMWTQLNLHQMDQATHTQKLCLKALRRIDEPGALSMLLDALGDYHAYRGELDKAAHYWSKSPPGEAFATQAELDLVKIQAVRGLKCVHSALRALAVNEATIHDITDLKRTARDKLLKSKQERRLLAYQAALERIVPKSEQWQFGLASGKQ
jgi:hypothetical protein